MLSTLPKNPRILVLAPFIALPLEPQPSRFMDLARRFSAWGDVSLVSSGFQHFEKQHRCAYPSNTPIQLSSALKLWLLDEPGYSRNIGMKRLISHARWLRQLKAWLAQHQDFDLVYCACPFTHMGAMVRQAWPQARARIILDIQDLWPQVQCAHLGLPSCWGQGLDRLCNTQSYRAAQGFVAVSKRYLLPALQAAPGRPSLVAPLAAPLEHIADIVPAARRDNRLRLAFAGTLGHSQNLAAVIDALVDLPQFQLLVIGDGPQRNRLEILARTRGVDALFTGPLSHQACLAQLKAADMGLYPMRAGALQSHTNKIADYLACGLPILAARHSPEIDHLCKLGCGWSYAPDTAQAIPQLRARLRALLAQPQQLWQARQHAREQAQQRFDSRRVYAHVETFVQQALDRSGAFAQG